MTGPSDRISRRTRRTPDALRAQILDAASELFLRDGYASTSIDAVIEKVGGSKRAIYSHFGGKEDLFAAMVTGLSEQAVQAIPDEDARTGSDDVRASLVDFARAIMRILMDPRTIALYRLVVSESARMPGLAEAFLQYGPGRATSGLTRLLERWSREGLLRIGDPQEAAEHFIGMLRDDSHLEVVLGVRKPLGERAQRTRVERAVDIFLDGVGAH